MVNVTRLRYISIILISALCSLLVYIIASDILKQKFQLGSIPENKLILVIILIALGGYFRLRRTQILLTFIKPNSLMVNFQGASLGHLINLIIPFRLGEIMRGYYISKKLRISFGFSLGTIGFDRGLDVLVICTALLFHYLSNGFKISVIFSWYEIALLVSGAVTFIALMLLIFRTKLLFKLIDKVLVLFNEKIAHQLGNSLWGLILSFQTLNSNRKLAAKYLSFVAISWGFVFCALLILSSGLQISGSEGNYLYEYVPFLSYVILKGSDLFGNYIQSMERIAAIASAPNENFLTSFTTWTWILFTLPYLIVGLAVMLHNLFTLSSNRVPLRDQREIQRSFSRQIAPPEFLKSFFKREQVIEEIYRRSVSESYKILEFFKGGSNAVTMLIEKSSSKVVHKVVGLNGREKLIGQEEWLRNTISDGIVKVRGSSESTDYYVIELEFLENSVSLYEFIHSNSLNSSKKVLVEAINILENDVYSDLVLADISSPLQDYLELNFYQRILEVSRNSTAFSELINLRVPIVVNGQQYMDLMTIMGEIRKSEKCTETLSQMKCSKKCHGDFTIDNILVLKEQDCPILIDPSDDNILKGPLFDLSRLMQSLLGGYEFLNLDHTPVEVIFEPNLTHINFLDLKSFKYTQLADWLYLEVLPSMLDREEIKSIKFHVGVFYTRMLTHRLLLDENTMLKYLAISTQLLNEFYQEVHNDNY